MRWNVAIALLALSACAHPSQSTDRSGSVVASTEMARPLELRTAYHAVDGRTGLRLDDAALTARLRAARVLFVGEQHADPMSHFAELEVLARVGSVDGPAEAALGLEMLPRSKQAALTSFVRGLDDEVAFLAAVDWDKTWGFDYGFYRPLLELCRAHGVAAHALNAERALVHRVAEVGLEGLTPDEKGALPEIMIGGPSAHREFVRQAFLAHHAAAAGAHDDPHRHDAKAPTPSTPSTTVTPPTPPPPAAPVDEKEFERFYQAQLVWDETMAQSVARIVAPPPSPLHGAAQGGAAASDEAHSRHVVVVAGAGHCRRDAVPGRLARRLPSVATLIVLPAREEDVKDLVAEQAADLLWVPGR